MARGRVRKHGPIGRNRWSGKLFHATSQYLADQKSYYEQTKIERESVQHSVAEI